MFSCFFVVVLFCRFLCFLWMFFFFSSFCYFPLFFVAFIFIVSLKKFFFCLVFLVFSFLFFYWFSFLFSFLVFMFSFFVFIVSLASHLFSILSSFFFFDYTAWYVGYWYPRLCPLCGSVESCPLGHQRSPGSGNVNWQELFWRSPSWHRNMTWYNSLQVPALECFRPNNRQDRNATCPSADRVLKVILSSLLLLLLSRFSRVRLCATP